MPLHAIEPATWTDDLQLAASALEAAAKCYRIAAISDESEPQPPTHWLAEAEHELGRATRFVQNATASRMAELAERAA